MTVDSRSTRTPILSKFAMNRLRDVLGTNTGTAFEVDTTPVEVATWEVST
jgi:hypothetical protein